MSTLSNLLGDWYKPLTPVIDTDYFKKIIKSIIINRERGYTIIPSNDVLFYNFKITPPKTLRVVILEECMEAGEGKWYGLPYSSSYANTNTTLTNIITELELSKVSRFAGHISTMDEVAKQGVLFLNTVCCCFKDKPESFYKAWQPFIKTVIKLINTKDDLVIVLQKDVIKYKELFTNSSHTIITCPNFKDRELLGSNTFKIINEQLNARNKKEILY